VDKGGIIAL